MTTQKSDNNAPNIAFIGGGNMAQALISGLLAKGFLPEQLHVADPSLSALQTFTEMHVATYDANDSQNTAKAIANADIVVLAIKPQVVKEVLTPLKDSWANQMVISILAGITTQTLENLLGKDTRLVRAMPNTPAMIQMGATGLYATPAVSESQKQQAETIMKAAGLVLWLEDENLLHAVTAVSGSAPAYFFYLLENMITAGEELGLTHQQATALAMQTALGSAQMALTSADTPATLRKKVTSPNGTTQAAIEVMDNHQMNSIIQQALKACMVRSEQISEEFGK